MHAELQRQGFDVSRKRVIRIMQRLDLRARRPRKWKTTTISTPGPAEAFDEAVLSRRPSAGLTFHSDRGSQFTSHRFQQALTDHDMIASMSRRGDCFDNAVSESFFATYKNELMHLQSWPTPRAAIAGTADFIDAWYNTRRLHSTLSYRTPAEVELAYRQQLAAA